MDTPAIHLKDLIDTRLEQPPVWIAYPGSETFRVLMRPMGNRQQEFVEAAQFIDWDLATMSRKVKVDQEQYLKLFCAWVIVDWQGLTMKDLRTLILLREPKRFKGASGEIGCDEAAKMLLMQHSPVFSTWVHNKCRDIERFNMEREEDAEKKPWRPSGSGSTTPASTADSVETTSKRTALSRNAMTARSNHGTERPNLSWRCMILPALGAILTTPGLKRHLTTLQSRIMSGLNTAGWYWPCTAA